jgi:hypothetical protein
MLYGTSLVAERKAGIAPFLSKFDTVGEERKQDYGADERLLPFFRAILVDAGMLPRRSLL